MSKLKAYEVLPHKLYQRGDTRGCAAAAKREAMTAWNVRVVVNLYHHPDQDLMCIPGLRYIHRPMADGRQAVVLLPELVELAAEIEPVLGEGAILTNCYGGLNRSGLMSALLLRAHLGISGAEAADRVRAVRPRALSNPYFCGYLDTLGPL